MQLRDYQADLTNGVYQAWNQGADNVCAVSATGSGKTVMMSSVVSATGEPTLCIAHRQELVSQISLALAKNGIYHSLIASEKTIKFVVNRHINKIGRNYYNSNAPVSVCGVDTLIKRNIDGKRIKYWHIDEGHHLLRSNKWGAAVDRLPNARGVGWTATPVRADNKSLHSDHGGLYNTLVNGPSMRWLITQGFLSRYTIIGPKSSINRDAIEVSSKTGDFGAAKLRAAGQNSTITGDVVIHYLRHAFRKRTIIFAIDVPSAVDIAQRLKHFGVRAEALSGRTDDYTRSTMTDRFENGSLDVLVNVDLFGEGFDVPAVECVVMARPTQSFGLYSQQFGRVLRIFDGKTHGVVIDAVNNVKYHGLPDADIPWSLEMPDFKKRKREIPIRYCVNPECLKVWEGFSMTCPYCGHRETPAPDTTRSLKQIEGDLTEYSPELLEELRQQAERNVVPISIRVNSPATRMIQKNHDARREAQLNLRNAIAWWSGTRRHLHNEDDSTAYRRFYHMFGVDVMTAQTLSGPETERLTEKIWKSLR